MKKSVAVLILAATVMLAACSEYTCPTYTKAPAKTTTVKQNRI
ncbi:hypothetical protein [Chryseolinea lacunae]|nr:hypothetical protein [Chryseolinea lacunae]